MIAIIRADGTAERRQLDAMRARAAEKNVDIELVVKNIMDHVRTEASRRLSGIPFNLTTVRPMSCQRSSWTRRIPSVRRS